MKYASLLLACATIALAACESSPTGPTADPISLAPSLARIRVDQTFEIAPFLVENVCEPEPVLVSGHGVIRQRGFTTDDAMRLTTRIELAGSGVGTLTEDVYGFRQVERQEFVQTNDPFRAEGQNTTILRLDRLGSREDLLLETHLSFVCTAQGQPCEFNVMVLRSECGGTRD
jgi:hypothetical protein